MDARLESRGQYLQALIRESLFPFSLFLGSGVGSYFVPTLVSEWPALRPHGTPLAILLLFIASALGGWFLFRIVAVTEKRLIVNARSSEPKWDDFLYPFAGLILRGAIPVILLLCILDPAMFTPRYQYWVEKLPPLVAVFAVGWILYKSSFLLESVVLNGVEVSSQLENRGLVTRIRLLKRIAVALIVIFTISLSLLLFEPLRHLGTSLLASAGILGVVFGLAAQRTFGNLFAGIQIAFSQPIRIGDQLKLENEVGVVEEITLTYVVVKLWDLRRLMLPISYFIENPFQNWTRTSTNIIGTVNIYVDFSAPVAAMREHFRKVVESSKYWNKNTCALHVTSCDDVCMELRLIASAPTAGDSFELQCEVREKMLDFLRREFPQALPRARNEQKAVEVWDKAVNER